MVLLAYVSLDTPTNPDLEMSSSYERGVTCWYPDEKLGWIGAQVDKVTRDAGKTTLELTLEDGSSKTVTGSDEDIANNKANFPPLRNPPALETSEDLTGLSYLNEPAVLEAIRARYAQLSIYTFSGIVLIATNPFDRVDNLYTSEVIDMYARRRERSELLPHLFSIAGDAYSHMKDFKQNQTIVVSGESGAGKTVSAKYIMRYFASAEDPQYPRKALPGGTDLSDVEREILATNPIMEAFGNAKTTRNDNSSRFGKYLEIQFSDMMQITGARIRTYLLERSRIVFHPPTERNYHIFYQLVKGATGEQKEKFGLGSVSDYNYLNQGDPDIQGVDDAEDFQATCRALDVVGIDSDSQSNIFQVIAALLHLGNTTIKATRSAVSVSSEDPELAKACELLGVPATDVAKWFMKKQIMMRSEKIMSDLDHKTALVVRDSVAKYVYSALFDWLVAAINVKLEAPEELASTFIGVLDIYGFEHFKTNSFEQFCINYANEKLQQEFNQHVFKLEQDEYEAEDLDWTYIDFVDNQPCIALIEAKLGILGLLDEESRLPAGSDDGFVQKLYSSFGTEKHQPYFKKPRFGQTSFVVGHYAMDVAYEVDGFIEKNRDTVPDQLVDVLNNSNNEFLRTVLDAAAQTAAAAEEKVLAASKKPAPAPGAPGPRAAAKPRKPTLGNIFKNSLIDLMDTINSTNVHYIRCIKPNESKEAWKFDGPMVLSQLRACGVLETIRISSAGFPSRMLYEDFAHRYDILVHSSMRRENVRQLSEGVLKAVDIGEDKYQLGKTKMFLRVGMLAFLERKRNDRHVAAATTIQKLFRMHSTRAKYRAAIADIIKTQTAIRGFLVRLRARLEREDRAIRRLQAQYRGNSARRHYEGVRNHVRSLQTLSRGFIARKTLVNNRKNEVATHLQAALRGYLARNRFKRSVKSVKLVQSMIRRRGARAELQHLREERQSVKHFEEVQYHLENKVIELQNLASGRADEIRGLNEQLKTEKAAVAAQVALLAAAQAAQAKQSTSHAKELASHQEKFSAADRELKELKDTHSKLEVSSKQELASRDKEINQLKATLAEKESTITELTAKITELEQAVEKARRAALVANANGSATSMVGAGAMPRPRTLHGRHASHSELEEYTAPHESYYRYSDGEVNEINDRIEKMLVDSPGIREELIAKLVRNLVVPTPKTDKVFERRDIVFPANMINLVISELWRFGYTSNSESFIGSALESIQEAVQKVRGEKIIPVGAFWLSNAHEIYSFLCLAETNILQNAQLREEMSELEMRQYQELMSVAKVDAESVIFNIYFVWMKEIKKIFDKMIVSAVVEEQSIPGFQTDTNPRFLTRFLPGGSNESTMNDLLTLITRVYTALTAFHLEDGYVRQPILELLEMAGAKAFNDMIMRKNFLSWKRAVQINYNVARIEEWCKGHSLPEGALSLERLMQGAKLLQLKKSFEADVDILYDICWALTPAQIQRLITNYYPGDYEEPVPPKVLDYVAQRVKDSKDTATQLLLDVSNVNGVDKFEMCPPRTLQKIEPYMPQDLDVPKLRELAKLTTMSTRLEEAGAGEEDMDSTEEVAEVPNGEVA